jgi:GTP cyclohydrolase I
VEQAISLYYSQSGLSECLDVSHIRETPARFVKVLAYDVSGCFEDPALPLAKEFAVGNYDEMVSERGIRICTKCAHHGERIIGQAQFSYIPDRYIVGLSKIPRMIDVLCRRPQIQESLSSQIVDVFQETVRPHGCAVHVRAYHLCMIARGVQERMVITETVALRGVFRAGETRAEFLSSLDRVSPVFP